MKIQKVKRIIKKWEKMARKRSNVSTPNKESRCS